LDSQESEWKIKQWLLYLQKWVWKRCNIASNKRVKNDIKIEKDVKNHCDWLVLSSAPFIVILYSLIMCVVLDLAAVESQHFCSEFISCKLVLKKQACKCFCIGLGRKSPRINWFKISKAQTQPLLQFKIITWIELK